MKKLAIIIIDWNGAEDTIECLECLKNESLYDIYLLDNGSYKSNVDKVLEYLQQDDRLRNLRIFKDDSFKDSAFAVNYVLSTSNKGFAIGNNYIAEKICDRYEYILLLNNDTDVPSGTIEHMVKTASEKGTVALTCDIRSYYQKEKLWNAGGYFTFYGDRKYYRQKKIDALIRKGIRFVDAEFITGCAFLITGEYVKKFGLFTDKFFHGEEDFNLCYRLKKKKFKVGVDLAVTLYHKVGRSIGRATLQNKNYNATLVHFTNRVIDFKDFYGKYQWLLWREMYLILVFLRRVTTDMEYKYAIQLIKRIKYYTNKYDDVKKPLFDELMKLTW